MQATFTVDDTVFNLPLSKLNLDVDINPRIDGLDQEHIQALLQDTPDTYPSIYVATLNNGVSYIAVDGYHRVYAAMKQEATSLRAKQVRFTLTDYDRKHPEHVPTALYLAAYEANIKHGKPLSIEERKEYALQLYAEDDSLSWLQLGKMAKLSDKTVKAYIEKKMRDIDQEKDSDTTPDEKDYMSSQADYTRRLHKALQQFFTNETAFFGKATGTRSETKRAKALVSIVQPTEEIADIYESLARSLVQASAMIKQRLQ